MLTNFPEFVLLAQRVSELEALQVTRVSELEALHIELKTLVDTIESVSDVTQQGVSEIQSIVSEMINEPRKSEYNRVHLITAWVASCVAAAAAMGLANVFTYMTSTTDKWHRLELT